MIMVALGNILAALSLLINSFPLYFLPRFSLPLSSPLLSSPSQTDTEARPTMAEDDQVYLLALQVSCHVTRHLMSHDPL